MALRARCGVSVPGLAKSFLAEADLPIETAWSLAALSDLADPRTKGQRPEDFEQTLAFSERLFQLAAADSSVHELLFEVLQLLKPRSVLNEPELVERVKAVRPDRRHLATISAARVRYDAPPS